MSATALTNLAAHLAHHRTGAFIARSSRRAGSYDDGCAAPFPDRSRSRHRRPRPGRLPQRRAASGGDADEEEEE